MSIYNFRLSDQVRGSNPGVWGEGTAYVVGTYLKEFFDEVCASPLTPYSGSDFWWDSSASDVRANEVLIYFLDSKADSLVQQVSPSVTLGPGGTTVIRSAGNLSEVYVRESLAAMGGARTSHVAWQCWPFTRRCTTSSSSAGASTPPAAGESLRPLCSRTRI